MILRIISVAVNEYITAVYIISWWW